MLETIYGHNYAPLRTAHAHPSHKITAAILSLLGFALIGSLVLLLSVSDPVYLKQLIEDSGAVPDYHSVT